MSILGIVMKKKQWPYRIRQWKFFWDSKVLTPQKVRIYVSNHIGDLNPGSLTRVRNHENSQSELCLQSNSKTMCKLIQAIFSFICSLRLQWCVFKEKIDIIQNLTNLNSILHLTKMSPPTRVEPGFTPGWTRVEIQNSETIFWFCPYKFQINLKCFCKFFGGSWQCKLVSDTIWFRHLPPILKSAFWNSRKRSIVGI